MEEVRRLTDHFDPKIWVGILWLQTYPRIRPRELWSIRESDIDLELGRIVIPNPKEGKTKIVPLIPEDVSSQSSSWTNIPVSPSRDFFRHPVALNRAKAGDPHGQNYLAKWWNRACRSLGVEGVPLYRGTRHTTVTAMRRGGLSPEEIKRATGHATNKAFDRYLHIDENDLRKMFATVRRGKTVELGGQGGSR